VFEEARVMGTNEGDWLGLPHAGERVHFHLERGASIAPVG